MKTQTAKQESCSQCGSPCNEHHRTSCQGVVSYYCDDCQEDLFGNYDLPDDY